MTDNSNSIPPWQGFHHIALVTPDLVATVALHHISFALPDESAGMALRERLRLHSVEMTEVMLQADTVLNL